MPDPESLTRRRNWLVWAGFLLTILAFGSYPAFFVRFPVTRNFPWANLLLFAIALILLAVGIARPFRQPEIYKGKVLGPILSGLGVLVFAAFILLVFVFARQLPASSNAPRVGTKAPDFTLPDTNNHPVTLTSLFTSAPGDAPTRGVLLVFYRGYW